MGMYDSLFFIREKMLEHQVSEGMVEIRALEGRCMLTLRVIPAVDANHLTVWFYYPQSQVARFLYLEKKMQEVSSCEARCNLELLKQGISVEFTKKLYLPKDQARLLKEEGFVRRHDPMSWPIVYSYNDVHIYRRFPVNGDRLFIERCVDLIANDEMIATIALALQDYQKVFVPIIRYNRKKQTCFYEGEIENITTIEDRELFDLLNHTQKIPLLLDKQTQLRVAQTVTHHLPNTFEIRLSVIPEHLEKDYDRGKENYLLKIADERQIVANIPLVTMDAKTLQQTLIRCCENLGFFPRMWQTNGIFANYLLHSLEGCLQLYEMEMQVVDHLTVLDQEWDDGGFYKRTRKKILALC